VIGKTPTETNGIDKPEDGEGRMLIHLETTGYIYIIGETARNP
jgi:hypothetical protein